MRYYCTFWDEIEHRFREPIAYDYTFSVKFPNIIINAANLEEAKERIELINDKTKGMDRFDFDGRMILQWESSMDTKRTLQKTNAQTVWNRIKARIEVIER